LIIYQLQENKPSIHGTEQTSKLSEGDDYYQNFILIRKILYQLKFGKIKHEAIWTVHEESTESQ
jgi:hypothetical protein